MVCSNCHFNLEPYMNFCPNCGTKRTHTVPKPAPKPTQAPITKTPTVKSTPAPIQPKSAKVKRGIGFYILEFLAVWIGSSFVAIIPDAILAGTVPLGFLVLLIIIGTYIFLYQKRKNNPYFLAPKPK